MSFQTNCDIATKKEGKEHFLPVASSQVDIHDVLQTKKLKIQGVPFEEVPYFSKTWLMREEKREQSLTLIDGQTKEDLNTQDASGNTALFYWTLREDEDVVRAILAAEADPLIENVDGMTAFHYASKMGLLTIMKLLEGFGANLNATNKQGHSPLHVLCNSNTDESIKNQCIYFMHSLRANRCCGTSINCQPGCAYGQFFTGTKPETVPKARSHSSGMKTCFDKIVQDLRKNATFPLFDGVKGNKGLAIDGGGSAGIIAAQMLMQIEQMLGVPIVTKINWISGTSSGALSAMALALGRSTKQVHALFWRFKSAIFKGTPPYDRNILKSIIIKEFGQSTKMCDVKKNVIITTTDISVISFDQIFFRTYTTPPNTEDPIQLHDDLNTTQRYIADVLLSATLAPVYFLNEGDHIIDGGLCCNNPGLDLLHEIQSSAAYAKAKEEGLATDSNCSYILSIGTGQAFDTPNIPADLDLDISKVNLTLHPIDSTVKWYNLTMSMIKQATKKNKEVERRLRNSCTFSGTLYDRLDPDLIVAVKLDEDDTATLANALYEARFYLLENADIVKQIVDRLNDQ